MPRLGYIAYGDLLAVGTPREIVAGTGLATYEAEGENLAELSRKLRADGRIDQAVMFGTRLHVSAKNREGLEAAIGPYRGAYQWREIVASLEDVFIHLMEGK
jgi:ABC-2 type transport system ATP-binding protein